MQFRSSALTLGTLASLVLLAACDSSTGGGAGDSDDLDNLAAAELLAPFTGIYELDDGWKGDEGDRGILLIETPGSEGTSVAELYDYDDIDNCIPTRPSDGLLRKDDFSDRVFMDDIFQFDEAELMLSGSTLTITFNDDFDLDNDSDTQDRIDITAERVDVAQLSDLGPDC